MSPNLTIRIRSASLNDQEFILSLVPRLVEFGPPGWRKVSRMINTDIQVLPDKFTSTSPDTAFFIAEDENGVPLAHVKRLCTECTGERGVQAIRVWRGYDEIREGTHLARP